MLEKLLSGSDCVSEELALSCFFCGPVTFSKDSLELPASYLQAHMLNTSLISDRETEGVTNHSAWRNVLNDSA